MEEREVVRVAALRTLLRMLSEGKPVAFVMRGREQEFVQHLLDDTAPDDIAQALGLSLEEVAGGCIRVIRSGYAAARASRRA